MTTSNFSSYDQVGRKRDVHEIVSKITPEETPMLSMLKERKPAMAVKVEWLERDIIAAGSNAVIEGAAAPAASHINSVLRSNVCQLLNKAAKITSTARAIHQHGVKDLEAEQLAEKASEIKRDLEYHLCTIAQNAATGTDGSVARKFGNVFGQDADGVAMVHSSMVLGNSGTPRPLTKELLNAAFTKAYNAGGKTDVCMLNPQFSEQVAGFAYLTTTGGSGATASVSVLQGRTISGAETTITNVVDVYRGPLGTTRFTYNRNFKADEALLFSPKNMGIRFLQPWDRKKDGTAANSDNWLLTGEVTFVHDNYKSSVRISDLGV